MDTNSVDDEIEACCTVVTTYGILIGLGAAAGGIGQSIIADPNLASQISYQTAVQAGALAASIGTPISSFLNVCACGGNDFDNDQNGCVSFFNNFIAADTKANCFLPGSIAHEISVTIRAGGFGALYFIAGAGIKGALISPQAVAQAAAIGGLGNLILGGGLSLLFVSYHTIKNGKVDYCTPTITFEGCDNCPKLSMPRLPAWNNFKGAPKHQETMQRDENIPVAIPVDINLARQNISATNVTNQDNSQHSPDPSKLKMSIT